MLVFQDYLIPVLQAYRVAEVSSAWRRVWGTFLCSRVAGGHGGAVQGGVWDCGLGDTVQSQRQQQQLQRAAVGRVL